MSSQHIQRAAELLLAVREGNRLLPSLPEAAFPADIGESYLIQNLVTASLGPIGGWKTAPSKEGVKFNWAPIPAAGIFDNGASLSLAELPPCELELEIGFLVSRDLPPRDTDYTSEEVTAALSDMVVCLELFSSRYQKRTERSALEVLADSQNAFGAVIGTGLSDWHDIDLAGSNLEFDYAGETHTLSGGRVTSDLLDAVTDIANATGHLGGLRKGHIILTGARIGPIPARSAGPAAGSIFPVGAVSISLT
jgi:2-keto-4-pentenoate hydratase